MTQVESRPQPQRPSFYTCNLSETTTARRKPFGENHPEFFALHLNPNLMAKLHIGVHSFYSLDHGNFIFWWRSASYVAYSKFVGYISVDRVAQPTQHSQQVEEATMPPLFLHSIRCLISSAPGPSY